MEEQKIALMMLGFSIVILILHIIGFKLGERIFKGHKLERYGRRIGLLVVFCIFFGDQLVKYLYLQGLYYYSRFGYEYNMPKTKSHIIAEDKLNEIKRKYDNKFLKQAIFAYGYNEDNTLIYFIYGEKSRFMGEKTFGKGILIDLNKNQSIYQGVDNFSMDGGWLYKKIPYYSLGQFNVRDGRGIHQSLEYINFYKKRTKR